MTDPKLLDQKQLAFRWGMNPRTLENWRQQKKGPPFFKLHDGPKAPVRYRLEDIEEYERAKGVAKIETV